MDRWHQQKNHFDGLQQLVERNYQFLKHALIKETQRLQRAYKKQKKKETAQGKYCELHFTTKAVEANQKISKSGCGHQSHGQSTAYEPSYYKKIPTLAQTTLT
ncbi:hypothetical protein OCK74_11965 [Chitinophagaceae bacterium LB-8]|uniref:Uncharacterized protein n=1 Tax=Paraflavisolibacter caeni TaxID=2982496 RepID=A0A9X2XWB4_9BACT|nr:hypothetical protein [Paraflavisolibacter caeni]MCU7549837.1 hypothetical protein [Paraflavisolibacter caeni]